MNSTTYVKVLSKGPEAYLPDIENGKLRFTTDTGRLFLDSEDQRIEISDFVKDKTSEQILNTDSPLPKFYLASDNDRLYFYANDQWNTVKVDIGLATTASSGLIKQLNGSTVNFLRGDGNWAEAGNAKYEELEREDYEALTDDEKKNSTLYLVKDKREDPDLPALIGEYYKIDNSRLNPNVSTDYIRWYFNRSDAEYIYTKYDIYDWNFHPPYDGPGWGSNSNFLITNNMPVDTCYIMTLFAIYGLTGRMLVFIPKEIIDNGIGCMTRNGFYSTQDFEYYTIEFWGDWSDPASYGTIVAHTFECAGGIHHINPGQHFETTRMSFCNIPYLVGNDFIDASRYGRDLQESLDRYLSDKSYSEFPHFYDGNYFLYNGIMREYDGTLMVNDIDYTDRVDISKYALKASLDAYATTESLSGYATTAALAGKQDTLTAGTGISINGTTISSTGGGSSVSITPTLATGTKIADYSINGSTGELYAPNGGGGGSSVIPNPVGTPTENLGTIEIDGVIYDIPGSGGGTEVIANPEEEPTDTLSTIRIGDIIYDISGNSGGINYRDDLIFDTNVTSNGTFDLLDSLDNYDAVLISGYCASGTNQPIVSIYASKSDFYTQRFTLLSTVTGGTRRIFIEFPDSTHVKTSAIEGDISLRYIRGIKFGGLYTEELSDMTWTELTSVAGATSSAIPIPDGTKYLLLTSELGTNMNIVAYESIDTINKAITESGISTWNKGYEYYDISGNHTNIIMAVSNGEVTIKSGYQTVTAKVYALSGGVRPYENKVLAPMIYSTEEREVGTWIDNKPLYQKTYVKNNIVLTDNNWTNGILGTSGIYITDFKAYFGLENTSNSNFSYSYYRNNTEFFTSVIDTSHEDINVRPNMNAGINVTTGTITIWYTKNSDVPGSGSYNTFGELMHHYSTEEKIVGTWFDGNTLYEKSYTNFSSLTGQSRTLDFQLSGIDKIWYVSEGCLISNGIYPFPYIHYDTANTVGGFWDLSIAGSPKFEFRTGSQSTGAVINVFTIRYTKSTS